MKKALIIGPNGNLSSHLVESFSVLFDIVTLSRDEWDSAIDKFSNCEIVIQSAGNAKCDPNLSPDEYLESNLNLTAKALELSKKSGVKKFIYISSGAVYGDSSTTNEDMTLNPLSINGSVKKLNEDMVKSFCMANEIDYSIYRIFNMFGGKDTYSIIYKLIDAVENGSTFNLVNNGNLKRDFIHVKDVARVIKKTYQKSSNSIVNLGTGESTEIKDLIDLLKANQKEFNINEVNTSMAKDSVADIAKLKSICGDLQFVRAIDFLKEELNLKS